MQLATFPTGTHDGLLAKGGRYYELVNAQKIDADYDDTVIADTEDEFDRCETSSVDFSTGRRLLTRCVTVHQRSARCGREVQRGRRADCARKGAQTRSGEALR